MSTQGNRGQLRVLQNALAVAGALWLGACEGVIDDATDFGQLPTGASDASILLDGGSTFAPADATLSPPADATLSSPADATLSLPAADTGVSAEPTGRMSGMLEAHNRVRAEVGASPALGTLTWSDEIARFAQQWADSLAANGCAIMHRSGTDLQAAGYGENIAMFGGGGSGSASTADRAVMGWASEKSCWTFGTLSGFGKVGTERCDQACYKALSSDGCGHYTAIVWRKSTAVGCGVATCSRSGFMQDVWVCNYSPPGNYVGQTPY